MRGGSASSLSPVGRLDLPPPRGGVVQALLPRGGGFAMAGRHLITRSSGGGAKGIGRFGRRDRNILEVRLSRRTKVDL